MSEKDIPTNIEGEPAMKPPTLASAPVTTSAEDLDLAAAKAAAMKSPPQASAPVTASAEDMELAAAKAAAMKPPPPASAPQQNEAVISPQNTAGVPNEKRAFAANAGDVVPGAVRVAGIGAGEEKEEEYYDDEEYPHIDDVGPEEDPDEDLDKDEKPSPDETFEDEPVGDEEMAEQKKPEEKKKINEKFKDVKETGKWGSVSRKEIYIVIIVLLLVVVAVVLVVVFVVVKDDDDSPATPPSSPVPTPSPTVRPVLEPEIQLSLILEALESHEAASGSLALLPDDIAFYLGKAADPTQPPQVRAVSWILYDDSRDEPEFIVVRYALATLYFATNGQGWKDSLGWLTDDFACNWNGVICDRFGREVEQIELGNNLLNGPIPDDVNLLDDLRSLIVRNNELTGTVPSLALGSIPRLEYLYLEDNKLSGTITADLRANERLAVLMIQFNDLTGIFPREFCPSIGGPPILTRFGLDCDEMVCFCCRDNPSGLCY